MAVLILSKRQLESLHQLFGLKELFYVGNHGDPLSQNTFTMGTEYKEAVLNVYNLLTQLL